MEDGGKRKDQGWSPFHFSLVPVGGADRLSLPNQPRKRRNVTGSDLFAKTQWEVSAHRCDDLSQKLSPLSFEIATSHDGATFVLRFLKGRRPSASSCSYWRKTPCFFHSFRTTVHYPVPGRPASRRILTCQNSIPCQFQGLEFCTPQHHTCHQSSFTCSSR